MRPFSEWPVAWRLIAFAVLTSPAALVFVARREETVVVADVEPFEVTQTETSIASWYWVVLAVYGVAYVLVGLWFWNRWLRGAPTEDAPVRRRTRRLAAGAFVAALAFVSLNVTSPVARGDAVCEPTEHAGYELCVTTEQVSVGTLRQVIMIVLLGLMFGLGALAWRSWRASYLVEERLDREADGPLGDVHRVRRRITLVALAIAVPASLMFMGSRASSSREFLPLECTERSDGAATFTSCSTNSVEVARTVRIGSSAADALLPFAWLFVVGVVAWWAYVAAAEFLARRTSIDALWRPAWAKWRSDRRSFRSPNQALHDVDLR